MADTTTTNIGLTKPGVGDTQGANAWGGKLNANFDLIDGFGQASIAAATFNGVSNISSGAGTPLGYISFVATGTKCHVTGGFGANSSSTQNVGAYISYQNATDGSAQQNGQQRYAAMAANVTTFIGCDVAFTTIPGKTYTINLWASNLSASGPTVSITTPSISVLNA